MNFTRPNVLSCFDCTVEKWRFLVDNHGPQGATFQINFCPAHKRNFQAPPVPDPSSPTVTSSAANPSATSTSSSSPPVQAVVPGATTRLIPARQDPAGPGTSTAIITMPIQPSSTAISIPSAGPTRTTSRFRPSCSSSSVDVYNTVKAEVLASGNPTSILQALEKLGVCRRTFNRKRPIAELYLLDEHAFNEVRDELAGTSGGRRIPQSQLSARCDAVLKRQDMKIKRRIAVTEGRLI